MNKYTVQVKKYHSGYEEFCGVRSIDSEGGVLVISLEDGSFCGINADQWEEFIMEPEED